MSLFNTKSPGTKTENLAGGQAYTQTPELELISILVTSFANDQFYRTASETFERLKYLIGVCSKPFVARAAIYARTVFGMRSITHVVASELAKHIRGEKWAKYFFDQIIYRPDDMVEIMAYHKATNGKYPKAMLKGFAMAFDRFDAYSIAKYRSEGKTIKLIDVVNMCHPKPVEKNAEALAALINGDLKSFDTWETELTQAGQNAENEDQKLQLKKEVWTRLITSGKLGYFAMLKNLRNIIEQAPEALPVAIEYLTNPEVIKKSLVLPFRFLTATTEVQKLSGVQPAEHVRAVITGLSKAIDLSLANVPKFDGSTLVVLDVSESMRQNASTMGNKSPHIIGALFSAALVKANNCDLMTFDVGARFIPYNPTDSLITIASQMGFEGSGTNFHTIFQEAKRKYDRIIILSDMQGWINPGYTPVVDFNQYKERTGANPVIYSFDLQNYGSMQFPEKNVFCVAGFSEKIFDVMAILEKDRNALVNEVMKIELQGA